MTYFETGGEAPPYMQTDAAFTSNIGHRISPFRYYSRRNYKREQ